jgi:integrase
MGHISDTPAGNYRANWRDPSGRQRAKTFKTKKAARAFLAQVEADLSRGIYVGPAAGRVLFRDHAARWEAGRSVQVTTQARTASVLRVHVLPKWGAWPLVKIDHMSVQTWIAELSQQLAPASVAKCVQVTAMIMRAAVRSRLIPHNPCDDVQVPSSYSPQPHGEAISREDFFGKLLPAIPREHRGIVCVAAGAGLRWGECAGLPWRSVDLECAELHVVQVAIEVNGRVSLKTCPKTRAGARTVPLHRFVIEMLQERRTSASPAQADALVFGNRTGGPPRRNNFRRRVWRPSLVRAGLLGEVVAVSDGGLRAGWEDAGGHRWSQRFVDYDQAVAYVAEHAAGGLRFHDLRHCYATWLISDGLPVNEVQSLLGHEQASTTLNRYTHRSRAYDDRVRAVFDIAADFSLTSDPE